MATIQRSVPISNGESVGPSSSNGTGVALLRDVKAPGIILVGTDFSVLSDIAVESALALGRRFGASRVQVVHVLNQSRMADPIGDDVRDWPRKKAYEELEAIHAHGVNVTREVRDGIPARDLALAAKEINADLIVVASHGGALRRVLVGSVATSLIRTAECPVLVVGEDRRSLEFSTVVAGVVPSAIAASVVAHAVAFAAKGGQVLIVSAFEHRLIVDDGPIPRLATADDLAVWRTERIASIRSLLPPLENGPAVIVEALEKAPPATVILETSKSVGADLIVVGRSGRNFWHRMVIGSTAARVVADARCPVLVVPPSKGSD